MKTCADGHGALAHHGTECPACEEAGILLATQGRMDTLEADTTEALVVLLRAVGQERADRAYREAFEG